MQWYKRQCVMLLLLYAFSINLNYITFYNIEYLLWYILYTEHISPFKNSIHAEINSVFLLMATSFLTYHIQIEITANSP